MLEAWKRYSALMGDTTAPGSGVTIGHPDTGFLDHPAVSPALLGLGFNFFSGEPTAVDDTDDGFAQWPGHGTRTASVIAGTPFPDSSGFSGVAPGARLIPLRVARRVVLIPILDLDQHRLAMAIRGAALGDPNFVPRAVDVISISLGGPASRELQDALSLARERGVIVVAAAGNQVPDRVVGWPAAYDGVIAVAATNSRSEVWSGSSRGAKVAISAPGENVWAAKQRRENGVTYNCVEPGTGTSYATATVAGVAALWLSYRAKELSEIPRRDHPALFEKLLRCSARRPANWPVSTLGAGIVDADRLLGMPLRPEPANC